MGADGVLITGLYGAGKSSVAAELAFAFERRGEPYAMLDLDYLSWAGTPGGGDRASELGLLAANLAAVAANYRRAGIGTFVLAYFVRDAAEAALIRQAAGVPLRVVRLVVPYAEIERRLTGDVTSGRQDDLVAAAEALDAGEGAGVEDLAVAADRPVDVIAAEILDYLGWSDGAATARE
jgi:GNAT superfamily N-acetyltransferase